MTQNSSGKIGKCYKGMLEYHLSNDPLTTNQISVACWVEGDSFGPYNNIIFCANTSDSEDSKCYFSIISNTTLNFGINASSTYSISYTFATNIWYHVAATYDGDKIRLYVNGELKGTSNSLNITPRTALNYGIMCRSLDSTGINVVGWSQYYNDFRLYDHCLSPKEVHEIAKGLVLHYPMNDEYVETTVYDCSGYCNNGTVTGNLQVVDDSPRYKKSIEVTSVNKIQYLSPIPNQSQEFTFNIWSKITDPNAATNLWTPHSNGSKGICQGIGNGSIYSYNGGGLCTSCSFYNTSNEIKNAYPVFLTYKDGNWHMYTIVGNNDIIKTYTDGISTCTSSLSDFKSYYLSGFGYIGYTEKNLSSDFRIYSTALSEDDIKELYNTSAIINNNNTLEAYEFSESNTYSINKSGVLEGVKFIEQDGDVQINNTEQVFATEFTEI